MSVFTFEKVSGDCTGVMLSRMFGKTFVKTTVGFTYICFVAARTSNLVDDIVARHVRNLISVRNKIGDFFRVINNDKFNGLIKMTPNFRNA